MRSVGNCLLAGLFLAAAGTAQVSTPVIPVSVEQSWTTGIVSFIGSQTAQLNVLNIAPIPTATTGSGNGNGGGSGNGAAATVPCQVQLSFYDTQNHLVKQGSVVTVAPQTAVTLNLTTSQVPAADLTTPRMAIRGVVKVEPVTPATGSGTTIFYPYPFSCQLVTTLELFDTVGGITQTFTSDTRLMGTTVPIPLAAGNRQ